MADATVVNAGSPRGYSFIDLALRFVREVPIDANELYTLDSNQQYRFNPGDIILRAIKDWIKKENITFDQIGIYLAYCRLRPSRFHRQISSAKFNSLEDMLIGMLEQIILTRVRSEFPTPASP